MRHMTKKFFEQIFSAIKKVSKTSIGAMFINETVEKQQRRTNNDEDECENETGKLNVIILFSAATCSRAI